LVEILLAGAVAAGFESEYWSMPRVRQVVLRRFGATYHVDSLGKLLRRLGFTPQKPARRSRGKNPRAAEEFRRKTWPAAVKKGA
jgi:transposase